MFSQTFCFVTCRSLHYRQNPQKKTTVFQVVGKSIGKKGKESLSSKLISHTSPLQLVYVFGFWANYGIVLPLECLYRFCFFYFCRLFFVCVFYVLLLILDKVSLSKTHSVLVSYCPIAFHYALNVLNELSTFLEITFLTASISVEIAFCSVSSCFNFSSKFLSCTCIISILAFTS